MELPAHYFKFTPQQQELWRHANQVDENGNDLPEVYGSQEEHPLNLCKTDQEKKMFYAIWFKYGKAVEPSEFHKYPLD